MAATYKPISVFDYSQLSIKNMPIDTIQTRLLDDVSKMIWMYAPWRWTIGTFDPVTITSGQTDFNIVNPPTDFLYIAKAYITNGEQNIDLLPTSVLPANPTIVGQAKNISYLAGVTPKFRLYPGFGSLPSGQTWTLRAWYKKVSPVITRATMSTPGALVMDDEYFWVFLEGCMYKSYFYADDARAGNASVDNKGNITYTGQRGFFEAAMLSMKTTEPMLDLSILGQV